MQLSLLATLILAVIWVAPTHQSSPRAAEQVVQANKDVGGNPVKVPVGTPLSLCECERATGYPNGLGCNKEGWFISSFERSGTWAGGGEVPLSHAICCRLCLPEELPVAQGERPTSIVSTSCHLSTGQGYRQLSCEGSEPSFATSFSHAEVANPFYGDIFYPLGRTECCSPTLLLPSGQAWQLNFCNCEYVDGVDCGGMNTHKLLVGFASARVGRDAEYVPVAPQQCCSVCMGSDVKDLGDCSALGYCHSHGFCYLGSCECDDGWGSADCSVADGDARSGAVPAWATWAAGGVVVGGMTLMLITSVIKTVLRLRRFRRDADSEQGEQLQEPLLLRIDEEGSVGSQDTGGINSDDEDADVEGRAEVCARQHSLPGGLLTAEGRMVAATAEPHPLEVEDEDGSARRRRRSAPGDISAALEIDSPPPSGAEGSAAHDDEDGADSDDGAAAKKSARPAAGSALCCICMTRPIQVALVPCGHASLCRRCSRRLEKCPFCRKDIARRQRIFYST